MHRSFHGFLNGRRGGEWGEGRGGGERGGEGGASERDVKSEIGYRGIREWESSAREQNRGISRSLAADNPRNPRGTIILQDYYDCHVMRTVTREISYNCRRDIVASRS